MAVVVMSLSLSEILIVMMILLLKIYRRVIMIKTLDKYIMIMYRKI